MHEDEIESEAADQAEVADQAEAADQGEAAPGAATGNSVVHWTQLHDRSMPWPMGWGERLLLGFVTLCLISAFAILALRTEPDPRGLGTHEQLGMEPCGWLQARGSPCPTCGCTTAASLLVHLRPLDAFVAQPFGALLGLAAMAFCLLALIHIARSRSFLAQMAWWPWLRILALGLGVLLGSWYYLVETWQRNH